MVYLGVATLCLAAVAAVYAARSYRLLVRQADADVRRAITFGSAIATPVDAAQPISRMTIDVHTQPGHPHRQVAVWALREDGQILGESGRRDLGEDAHTAFEIPVITSLNRGGVVIFSLRDSKGREIRSERRHV